MPSLKLQMDGSYFQVSKISDHKNPSNNCAATSKPQKLLTDKFRNFKWSDTLSHPRKAVVFDANPLLPLMGFCPLHQPSSPSWTGRASVFQLRQPGLAMTIWKHIQSMNMLMMSLATVYKIFMFFLVGRKDFSRVFKTPPTIFFI